MRDKLMALSADVYRFGPLATVSLATIACITSLRELLAGQLSTATMLERFMIALLLATIAVRNTSRILMYYATRNVINSEQRPGNPGASKSKS